MTVEPVGFITSDLEANEASMQRRLRRPRRTHKLDRLARSKGDPRSIRATSRYQVDAACTSVSWRDCAGRFDGDSALQRDTG
jgi:hypothetical protein